MATKVMATPSAGAGGVNDQTRETTKAPQTFTRADKVKHVVALLNKKGASAAAEIKRRIDKDIPLVVKGIEFDAEVLQESLGIHKEMVNAGGSTAGAGVSASGVSPGGPPASGGGSVSEGIKRSLPAASRFEPPVKVPRTEHHLATEAFERKDTTTLGHLLKRPHAATVTTSTSHDPALPLRRKATDFTEAPASATTPPPLTRMRRAGSIDGVPRTTSTPCRSPRGSPRLDGSPGVPDTTPPSLGRVRAPGAPATSPPARRTSFPIPREKTAAAAPPRSFRPASFSSDAEDAFGRAAGGTQRASWDAACRAADAPRAPARQASQSGGLSPLRTPNYGQRFHATSEPSPKDSSCSSSKASPESVKLAKPESVRELKEQLAVHRIDFSNCVEKSELQDLWSKFETLCQRPLRELQASLAMAGHTTQPPPTATACAALLLKPTSPLPPTNTTTPKRATSTHFPATSAPSAPSAPPRAATPPPRPAMPAYKTWQPPAQVATPAVASTMQAESQEQDSPGGPGGNGLREQEAAAEVRRIDNLRRGGYGSASGWGFAVLAVQTRDIPSVQRGYRNLMKKLHPDKVQRTEAVARALDAIKEAKEVCERCLLRQFAPGVPRRFSFTPLCTVPGKRRYRLHWAAPQETESAPVRRFIVAAFDPAYGKALNVAVLEPDYDEEKKRFLSVEDLKEYELAEEELQKMPALWRQNVATMQVAAANDAGQSVWATLQVPLMPTAATTPSRESPGAARNDFLGMPGSSAFAREEELEFAEEVKSRSGTDLRIFLERSRKPQLVTFVKSMGWSEEGTKGMLVERVVTLMDRQRQRR